MAKPAWRDNGPQSKADELLSIQTLVQSGALAPAPPDVLVDTTYVSLDLELLDSAARGREILEIGAVRFRGEHELSTFSTLVRTAAPLNVAVTRLTGLAEDDLASAVPLAQALDDLERFVGSTPVVGQSVGIDAEHLRRAGLTLRTPLLDTFELAGLLMPGLPAYDLDSVASALGLATGGRRHRALADARLAMRVFNRLLTLVYQLDTDTLAHVSHLSVPLNWSLRLLFAEAQHRKTRELSAADVLRQQTTSTQPAWLVAAAEQSPSRETLVPRERRQLLDLDELVRALSSGGDVAARLASFEERPEQLQMIRAVAEALNNSEHLLVEAGTGTGKSLAYLLPAVHFALGNNSRVVVSTNTINLQDQLSRKELPTLRQATGLPFRFTILKGRTNYLCLRRWVTLLRAEVLTPGERSLLIKTLIWLPQTKTGDRAELRLSSGEVEAWGKVCALSDACSPQHCAYNRAGRCFLARARRAADSSHIVVVNHSLLLADLATRSRVLSDYRHLVIDEAHHLEDEATAQLGWRLGMRELAASLDRLWQAGPPRPSGVVPHALELLRRSGSGQDFGALDRLSAELGFIIGDLAEELPIFFRLLAQFVSEHGQRSDFSATNARLSAAMRAQPAWADVEISWDDQNQRLLRLLRGLGELGRTLESADGHSDEWEELSGELAVQVTFWDSARQRLWSVLAEADASVIAWLSLGRSEDVFVNAAPLHVGEQLEAGLFAEKESVILTSATLTTQQSFDYIRERLGAGGAAELLLGSPFDYSRAALVCLPTDIPEPNMPGYQAAVERTVGQLIAALDGRTLVLFTSYSQLRATFDALREPLEARQIVLLGQRMNGASRSRLLESFKTGERMALLGTTSFWEGVDVVGEALSCLVIARLPFTTPSDPVFQARSELFEDPFGEYAVPQAILRFRQGFGRLIRSRSDRGAVVVLDRRIKSKPYGRAFLDSLPPCRVLEATARQVASAAREWVSTPVPLESGAAQ